MMRKKQIFRMLVGALIACMATACSNETDTLNGFPTDGNTLSVNLRTKDIGANTRTIATADESEVTSLSAYLFDKQENGSYALEKVYNNLPWSSSNETHSVALTGIQERGPKRLYFVANGTGIDALKSVNTGLPEADFKALLMNKMETNPVTPLPMTAQAELAEWGEGVSNATIEEPVQLKRISARIDLKVDAQEGLTFTLTNIELAAAANSYIFPNENVLEDEETAEISGTTLYPYEAAAGTVKEVKVTGNVTVGGIEKEATFVVPFVNNEYADGIAIERNHRYTVHISHINGFYSVEAIVTVSDWSAADFSGDLQAGEELIMTATEFADEALAAAPAATAVYPADGTKSVAVALTAEDAKVYKIYVGSANIEAVTSWTALPEGWRIAQPADTRAEYLWEKSYWTLTIPANESQETKSLTIKAVNKLELANNKDTEKYVEITFTQEGKEETADHSKNPLLKWAEYNSTRTSRSGSQSTAPTSGFTNNLYDVGSYYQWGRNYGFTDHNEILTNGYYCNSKYGDVIFKGNGTSNQVNRYTSTNAIYSEKNLHFFLCSVKYGHSNTSNDWITGITGANNQYWNDEWKDRTESYTTSGSNPYPLPYSQTENWRLPTKAEAEQLVPDNFSKTKLLNGTLTELHEVNGVKVAMTWLVETHNSRQCLVIKALIVPNTFNESKLTSIDWNNKDVVTRIFPGNGNIEVQYGKAEYYGNYGYLGARYFVIPLPYGNYGTNIRYGMTTSQYPSMWLEKDCNDGRFGGFWTSESDPSTGDAYLFTYMLGGVNGDEYWIKVDTEDKDDAYSVRGVK